jgi:hypothetical protein
VTFAVEGEARDRDEGLLRAGDVRWMTAGSGVVRNEDVEPLGKLRILQFWMTLPSASRWAPARFAHMPHGSRDAVRRGASEGANRGARPFVGGTRADLVRVSRAYAEGRMPRVSELGVIRNP